jgi:ABC-2 type transport system permease protein
MNKFLAVIKREYIQRVRTKFFVVATVLGPVMMLLFTVVPAYLAGIKAGGATRIAVVDESGKLYERFSDALVADRSEDETDSQQSSPAGQLNSSRQEQMKRPAKYGEQGFAPERVEVKDKSLEEIKRQLSERVLKGELDVYLVIPRDILTTGKAEFYGRNTGDVFTRETVTSRLNNALRDLRLAEQHVPPNVVKELNRRVSLSSTKVSARGEEKDSGGGFVVVFAFGFIIYLTTLMYGQMILAAVIEEKETRIAEILFSSIRSFPLMMGKLVGVSLVALTQLGIWGLAFLLFTLYGVGMLAAQGAPISMPHIPAMMFVYFTLYFLLGYFLYATMYALVGSMVTTTQEGGQLALPIVLLLIGGFYLAFPIIRSPNSSLAFWASMFPFFAPITMLVRIVTETPPWWQIVLSLAIGFATVVGLVWVASRIYRVGMLMTGKKASIPEVWRWVRQA